MGEVVLAGIITGNIFKNVTSAYYNYYDIMIIIHYYILLHY